VARINPTKAQANAGFTLLEVLMVSMIMFFLTYTVFISVRQTVDMKENIDERTSSLQEVRALMGLLQRDLEQTIYALPEDLGWNPKKPDPRDPEAPPPPPKPETIHIFQGSEDYLFISTSTHQRTFQDARENEQHFVTYQIVDKSLVRAESTRAVSFADREDPSQFKQFALLPNVSKLKFEYYNPKRGDWDTSWDTQKEDNKDFTPSAVRVLLEFESEDPKVKKRLGKQTLYSAFRVGEDLFRNTGKVAERQRPEVTQ